MDDFHAITLHQAGNSPAFRAGQAGGGQQPAVILDIPLGDGRRMTLNRENLNHAGDPEDGGANPWFEPAKT